MRAGGGGGGKGGLDGGGGGRWRVCVEAACPCVCTGHESYVSCPVNYLDESSNMHACTAAH